MYLTALTENMVEQVRQWRNQDISMYRTPFYLTTEMQSDFYKQVVCNRQSEHRYYAVFIECDGSLSIKGDFVFIGMIGLINISLENRNAEISIVLDPELRGKGYGKKVFQLLLDEGFNKVNLDNIYGECYWCSPALDFWRKVCEDYKVKLQVLPQRKFYNGKYFDSIYFNFNKEILNDNI
jgi:RimJ/RimL family protein N-acetyltransferase